MENKLNKPKEGEIIKLSSKKGKGFLELGKKIYIGTINIFIPPLAHFHTGRYKDKKYHLILDTFLALLVFALLGLSLYSRSQINKNATLFNFNTNHVVKPGVTAGLDNSNLNLTNTEVKTISNINNQPVVREQPKTILGFTAFGNYSDFGAGPLPPKVGAPTIYRLFFEISDPTHSLQDISVTAILPKGVSWNGTASSLAGSAPHYNQSLSTVTWAVKKFPKESEKIQASFDVRIIPNKNHIGHVLELLSESVLIYSYPNDPEKHILKSDHLTTQLRGDNFAQKNGIVVE